MEKVAFVVQGRYIHILQDILINKLYGSVYLELRELLLVDLLLAL